MKTWLVTGGAGFIGSNLIKMIMIRGGIRVVNLDKLTYAGNLESLVDVQDHPDYMFIHGSISDRVLVSNALNCYQPDAVVNLAAETHVDRSVDGPAEFVQTNIVGTFDLLEEVLAYWNGLIDKKKQNFRFLQVSTDEVFGSLGEKGLFTEQTRYAPRSPYAASKAAADHMVKAYYSTFGLPVLVTNCSNNFGPYQFPEKLIPLMIINAIEGKQLPVYGDGQNVRDWLYVEDHCRAIMTVLEKGVPGTSYNIGGNNERTNLQVVHAVCSLCDKLIPSPDKKSFREQIVLVQDRPGHDRRYAVDAGKIKRELGWEPVESFETGLLKTVTWYVNNPSWYRSVRSEKYGGERLGLGQSASERKNSVHKGIILAGGYGMRLHPLTRVVNKQLMPVYDKPLIYYPLGTLMLAGITEILVITTPADLGRFQDLLKDGRQWGINISYEVQPVPGGLAQAFIIGRDFIGHDGCALVLGDNIFYGPDFARSLRRVAARVNGATVFVYRVRDPERYGVAEFDETGKVISLEEKPTRPKSDYAVTGLYFYDNQATDMVLTLKPSARGELEITDLNKLYLQQGQLRVEKLNRGFAWLDAGTPEALMEAANFIETIEKRQGFKISCPEEIAYNLGYISRDQVLKLAEALKKNEYGQYLINVVRGGNH